MYNPPPPYANSSGPTLRQIDGPQRQSEISQELSNIDATIAGLNSIVDKLGIRLIEITSQQIPLPTDVKNGPNTPLLTPLAQRLNGFANMINSVNSSLNEIIDRIEL